MENGILKITTQTGNIFNECSTDYEYLFKCFSILQKCGFEAIDYNIDHFIKGNIRTGEIDRFWDKSLDELYEYFAPTKKAVEDSGICFSQAHASFPVYVDGNDAVNEYMMMSTEKVIAVCSFLGCKVLVVHPYVNTDFDKRVRTNLEIYRGLMPAAKKYGVKVCLEDLFTGGVHGRYIEGVCATAEEACFYIDTLNEEAGEDIFGFCFDVGHANILGKDIKSFITRLGDRLTCLHIHDNDGSYDAHMIPFTQVYPGNKTCTDWEGFIAGLKEINYKGNLSFETFRAIDLLPGDTKLEGLKLISAIGRYFRSRIQA